MRIPKAKQLPSGSWYIRIRVDGEDVSITRNTEAEAIAEAMSIKAGLKEVAKRAPKEKQAFSFCGKKYKKPAFSV
jgi:hypothetical protein